MIPRLVDLTLPLTPGQRGVAMDPKFTVAHDGWNAATWHLYSHAGTHMDSPIHFGAGTETIDTTPLEKCLGPATIVNLAPCAPRTLLTIAHLGPVAATFTAGESLLLRTDWHRHANVPAIYRDGLPRIGEDLAQWCVAHRVKILGVEPPSVADVNNLPEVTRIHLLLLGGGVTIVEGLAHLDQLTQPRVLFVALPLKLAGGDGCPVRAFAAEGVDPSALGG
ncbi:cyclase family protein [Horticoccus sp. 23ND18S-11]|uniref:cyclase family protein n=1 Tax=Horticoccus sp. 23ND18S-11 TaxID=3391832 RepID=UPI0039C8DB2D